MKPCFSKNKNQAWTIFEVFVVIAVMVVLVALLLPVLAAAKRRALRIKCVDNLKQINLACRDWEGNNNNEYPMTISVTNGGALENVVAGDVAHCFQVMSNELRTPKILICPADESRFPALSFVTNFSNANISYFINPDVSESYPQEIMTGDANLAIDGVPVKSGLVVLPSNAQVSWTPSLHGSVGNIGYADGSVAEVSTAGLQSSLILATNGTPTSITRLAIP